jgi:carboxyl-terminal processing protease
MASQQNRRYIAHQGWLVLALCLPLIGSSPILAQATASKGQLFDQIWQTVRDDFYDPQLCGLDWSAIADRYRPRAAGSKDQAEFARTINAMLDELNASHTVYLTWEDPRYYQLLGVFESSGAYDEQIDGVCQSLSESRVAYCGIGIDVLHTDEGQFVSAIYDGSPAQQAGLLVGDRLLQVQGEPFHPVRSFLNRAGETVTLAIQRVRSGPVLLLPVVPTRYAAGDMFMEAAKSSARLIEAGERRIAYVHLWSYSGQKYHDLLVSLLFGETLKDADALLLDLRDGWGGASPEYLNLFNRQIPELTMQRRNDEPVSFNSQWRKPVALLINGGVRSGKEVLAYGFKKSQIGPVVGSRTAGAVLAGALRFLPDHSVLYLAVADAEVDGRRLEGVGVEPTVAVSHCIPYCQGRDPQLDAGVRELLKLVGNHPDQER